MGNIRRFITDNKGKEVKTEKERSKGMNKKDKTYIILKFFYVLLAIICFGGIVFSYILTIVDYNKFIEVAKTIKEIVLFLSVLLLYIGLELLNLKNMI